MVLYKIYMPNDHGRRRVFEALGQSQKAEAPVSEVSRKLFPF